ncbi:hypothetical protein BCR44DRAFT_1443895 [Catenaria anguillulae PL171]|uniref:Transcription initiation factor TFIID subunit 4 n=1 Tax=Catenaria anguillulae PL171 TaxID=765915 RepID=A0A1Y2HA68_9FUNG|nr:hypothetical protein BCR44DRAFT_1443895 [Catenaria anguillulae PL171]
MTTTATTPPILPRTGSMGPGFSAVPSTSSAKPSAAASAAASMLSSSSASSSFKPTSSAAMPPKRAASTSLLSSAASSRASSPSPGSGTLTPQSASAVTAAGFNAVHVHMTPEAKREIVHLHEQQKKGLISSQEFVARAKELLGEEGFGSFMPGQQGIGQPRVVTTTATGGVGAASAVPMTSSSLAPGKKRPQESGLGKGAKKVKVMQKPVIAGGPGNKAAAENSNTSASSSSSSSATSAPHQQPASATTTAYPPPPADPSRPLLATDLALPRPGTLPIPDPLSQLINLPLLQTKLEYQVGAAGLKHVSESAIMYLALALQDRLRGIVERAVRVADGRVGVEVARQVAEVRAAVGKVGPNANIHAQTASLSLVGFDIKMTGNPWAALDVVRVKEEKVAEAEAAAAAHAHASSDRMDVDTPGTLAVAAAPHALAGGPKKKNTPGGTGLVTATRTPTPGATAFLAAGGAAKSWMTMGTGGSSAAATAAAMFGPPTTAGAAAAKGKRKNKDGASPKVGAVRSSALAAASGVALGVPGTGVAKNRKLTARDVLMAVQMSGPEEGGGKVNARGVGGVMARGWMRVRQK